MKRNPIYQALRNTRVVETLAKSHRNDARVIAANNTACRKLDLILDLYELGGIDHKELIDLKERAIRPYHAAVLRAARAISTFESRRRANRMAQHICPPGMSAYDFRTGRVHV